jgi:hypothetical protein
MPIARLAALRRWRPGAEEVDRPSLRRQVNVFEGDGAFVVDSSENRAQTDGNEPCMHDLIPYKKALAGTTLKGFHKNAVTVVVIEYKDVIVTVVGGNDKFISLVGVDLTGGGCDDCGNSAGHEHRCTGRWVERHWHPQLPLA